MQASDRILFLVTLYFPAKRVESQPAAISRIIFVKLLLRCCEVQFFPWSPVDFNLKLSSANLRAIARQIRFRCLAMLSHGGHEQPPRGLGRRHGLILAHFHDEEVCAALYPICVRYEPHGEKTGKTASLKQSD